jgi:hypothetical protein
MLTMSFSSPLPWLLDLPCLCSGGMENPCLTFVTPTLLSGDKSLASVVGKLSLRL